jgi:hypothetical protein
MTQMKTQEHMSPPKKKHNNQDTTNALIKQGVCHSVALPFTLQSILRQKMSDGNSNISPCKNIIFKKIL